MLATFFGRLMIKIMADWTACVQLRHANEVGGAYFSFTLTFMTAGIGMASALTYEEKDGGVSKEVILNMMSIACAVLVLSYGLFLASINQGYVGTFFDSRSGNKFIQDQYAQALSDKERIKIFEYNEAKWRGSIGGDIKGEVAASKPPK